MYGSTYAVGGAAIAGAALAATGWNVVVPVFAALALICLGIAALRAGRHQRRKF